MRCSAENIAFSIDKDPGRVQLEQKLEMPGFLFLHTAEYLERVDKGARGKAVVVIETINNI